MLLTLTLGGASGCAGLWPVLGPQHNNAVKQEATAATCNKAQPQQYGQTQDKATQLQSTCCNLSHSTCLAALLDDSNGRLLSLVHV